MLLPSPWQEKEPCLYIHSVLGFLHTVHGTTGRRRFGAFLLTLAARPDRQPLVAGWCVRLAGLVGLGRRSLAWKGTFSHGRCGTPFLHTHLLSGSFPSNRHSQAFWGLPHPQPLSVFAAWPFLPINIFGLEDRWAVGKDIPGGRAGSCACFSLPTISLLCGSMGLLLPLVQLLLTFLAFISSLLSVILLYWTRMDSIPLYSLLLPALHSYS